MRESLLNRSPTAIINAIEENLFAWIPLLGKLGAALFDNPPGVRRSITDIPLSLFNSIMDARLAPGQVDETIKSIMSDAASRQVPVLWWISPSSQPADLDSHLRKFGFSADEESDPCMAVDLENLFEDIPAVKDLSIQLVQDNPARQQWSRTLANGFETSAPLDIYTGAWTSLITLADSAEVLPYLTLLEGRPVATSLLFLAAGVAGIYCVATIPEARRKGIGTWATLYPLLQARAMGSSLGVLQASEMGRGVYRSLGFQEYCAISTFRWKPEKVY